MELVARGVINAETGDVVDVLVANGLDYRDPELDEMLEAWRSGEDVPELDELILPDPPDLADNPRGKSWSLVAATSLVRELWPSYNLAECEDLERFGRANARAGGVGRRQGSNRSVRSSREEMGLFEKNP